MNTRKSEHLLCHGTCMSAIYPPTAGVHASQGWFAHTVEKNGAARIRAMDVKFGILYLRHCQHPIIDVRSSKTGKTASEHMKSTLNRTNA